MSFFTIYVLNLTAVFAFRVSQSVTGDACFQPVQKFSAFLISVLRQRFHHSSVSSYTRLYIFTSLPTLEHFANS